MRIHSDVLTRADFRDAAQRAGVGIVDLTEHGSRTRKGAFNLGLTGSSAYRTQWGPRDDQAATWDEWGIFLAHLFEVDPAAHCGKNSYLSADHYHWSTGDRFRTLTRAEQHKRHVWGIHRGLQGHGEYAENECSKCGAVTRWLMRGSRWDDLAPLVAPGGAYA